MNGSGFRLRTTAATGKPFGSGSVGGPAPWSTQLPGSFGGSHSNLGHRLRAALVAAGAVAVIPALDLASWSMSADPWAGELFRLTGLLFVVAVAMSGASLIMGLAIWDGARPLPSVRLERRRAALLASTAAVIVLQLVQRFGPEDPVAGPALLALDLLLVGLLAAGSEAGLRRKIPANV